MKVQQGKEESNEETANVRGSVIATAVLVFLDQNLADKDPLLQSSADFITRRPHRMCSIHSSGTRPGRS